jgi:transcriptional regulator of acetoin/glycerol metabolism
MTRDLRAAILVSSNSPANIPETEPQFDDCNQAILLALAEQLFASIPELARPVQLPRTTMHKPLTQLFGFHVRHL